MSGGLYLAGWISYLVVTCWVVARHGPQALRDLAVAARAFPGTGFAVGIVRALGRK
jgi:hypothetical protein